MECPHDNTVMHMDSIGICTCVTCGYMYDQGNDIVISDGNSIFNATSKKPSYNNKDLMKRETTPDPHGPYPDLEANVETNDAGELKQSVEDTLKQRGNRYGEFSTHSEVSQKLKIVLNDHIVKYGQPAEFTPFMSEALEMIVHKLARIANGDPAYDDNWVDIAGYAQLVVDELNKKT